MRDRFDIFVDDLKNQFKAAGFVMSAAVIAGGIAMVILWIRSL
jgi:hypothetical protein